MFGIGSRCFYAICNGIVFMFESKMDRDCFVDTCRDAEIISATNVWKHRYPRVQVPYSGAVGADPYRKLKVREWYENKRRRV